MRIINASFELLTDINCSDIMAHLERCGRVCYKSEDRITEDSSQKFLRAIIKNNHEAMLEHFSFTVKFIVDRGVSHELVRHRISSFAQESSRYCHYGKDKFGNQVTFIRPPVFKTPKSEEIWERNCEASECDYLDMLAEGEAPQIARDVLNTSTKTEIIMTANIREWRHVFKLRCAKDAHPQMREVMVPLLEDMKIRLPILFDDIRY